MKYIAILNGKKYEVEIEKVGGAMPVGRSAPSVPISRTSPVPAATAAPVKSPSVQAQAPSPANTAGENEVLSPMPGNIWEVKVAPGDSVKAGQVLIVLEAMKMENDIVSPSDGEVASVLVKKGDTVDSDAVLVILK